MDLEKKESGPSAVCERDGHLMRGEFLDDYFYCEVCGLGISREYMSDAPEEKYQAWKRNLQGKYYAP